MGSNNDFGGITFDLPKNQSNVIKVIGVGGGGSNAINHMFKQGIIGVDFVICNTDAQALQNSAVPNKIQLGVSLTEGLGAGAKPEVGHQAALESIEEIEKMLDANTKMVFVTAGMGGGTGTGAAPVIAQLSKERGILTVGIVTMPFQFEGKTRTEQAMNGIEKLRKQVDSLIVINNNKLREIYGNLGFKAGFAKADEVLAIASKGIAEVITKHLTLNIDLKDAETVLRDSGTAIMGSATASGPNRALTAISAALDSPLLNDNKIAGAKNVLLLITFGANEITFDEMTEINEFIQNEAGHSANIIMGAGEDELIGESDEINVTIIATGFNVEQQKEIVNAEPSVIIHSLENEQKVVHNLNPVSSGLSTPISTPVATPKIENVAPIVEEKIVFNLESEVMESKNQVQNENELIPTTDFIKNLDVFFEIVSPVTQVQDVASYTFQEPKIEVPVVNVVTPVIPVENNINQVHNNFEFEIISSDIKNMEVIEPEFIVSKDEYGFELDLFAKVETPELNEVNENKIMFDLTETVSEIKVNEPTHVVPVTEHNQEGVIRYVLEDEIDFEPVAPVAAQTKVEEKIEESLQFTYRENPVAESTISNDISPVEMSIEETLRARAEERKRKMKDFNYKFNNPTRIEELEKEPAYKRSGIELNATPNSNNTSRMSLGLDSNNDIQLRSNNSFLHDNVD